MWQLKVLFVLSNCDFQNRSLNGERLAFALKTSQDDVESPFHLDWIVTFRKKSENKAEMTVESCFHFHWIPTFKKDHENRDKLTFTVKVKPKWQLKVLFLSLNCDFQKQSLKQGKSDLYFESTAKIKVQSPFHFIELRLCVTFCCKRKSRDMLSTDFDKLKTLKFQLWVLCHFQTSALFQNLFLLQLLWLF